MDLSYCRLQHNLRLQIFFFSGLGSHEGSIGVQQLYVLFNDPNTSLLICDTRPDLQYKESHIRDKCCVNVPQDIIPPGYVISICRIHISGLCKFDFQLKSIWNSFSKLQKNTNRCKLGKCIEFSCFIISNRITLTYIEKALPDDSREMFSQRGSVDHIILLDWTSSVKDLQPGTTLRTLKDALYKVGWTN